jgi:hypothetical protein
MLDGPTIAALAILERAAMDVDAELEADPRNEELDDASVYLWGAIAHLSGELDPFKSLSHVENT